MRQIPTIVMLAAVVALVGGVVWWQNKPAAESSIQPQLDSLSRTPVDPIPAGQNHASIPEFAPLQDGKVKVDPANLTELQRHNRNGLLAMERKDYEAAVGHFEDALTLGAGNEILLLNLSRALARWGKAERNAGDSNHAIMLMEKAMETHPDAGENASLLAHTLMGVGQRDRAKDLLEVALTEFPNSVPCLRLKAEMAFLDGELALAVTTLQIAQELQPENAGIQKRLSFFIKEQSMLDSFLRVRSTRFDCMYDSENTEVQPYLQQLLLDLEAASDSVNALLGLQPNDRLLVLLLSPEDYREGAPNWSNGLYDGRIRVPFSDYEKNASSLQATFRHEYTHAALHRIGPVVPTWLHEGLAQYVEGRDWRRSRRQLLGVSDSAPTLTELKGDWTQYTDRDKVQAAYSYSLSMTQWMIEQFGQDSLAALIQQMRSTPFEGAFQSAFGRSFEQADVDHRQQVLQKPL